MAARFQAIVMLTWWLVFVSYAMGTIWAEEAKDTREGEDITLKCRFTPQTSRETLTYYWAKNNRQTHDNVAIGNVPLDSNYKLNYHPEKGIYDLLISNASYDRDNGRFECKVKAGGSGTNLHVQTYAMTVLTAPQQPEIAPGSLVTVTEGKRQELTCSSVGGSPDPQVRWFREGSVYPLEASLKSGGSRDQPTTATLSIVPSKEDDDASFRCEVWNRALPDNKKLVSTVTLSVNYFPRVEVGPENPLRVELDSSATLECGVDAKPPVSSIRWTRNNRHISTQPSHVIHRVSIQDAGKYTCNADNGLGKVGERDIVLDVLFGPMVSVEGGKTREAEEGESVYVKCNVTANPTPVTVEWVREGGGKPEFRQQGDTLRISHVTAEHTGTYVCRAVNILTPTPSRRIEKVGNASIALLVRHRPGRARVMPDRPIAVEGNPVTLTCVATPSGWPAPQYRWFRIGSDGQPTILATGPKYTISNAHLGTEGVYNCQANNELGPGDMASVNLQVHQPPNFKYKLKPLETKRAGEPNFSVACSAKGKPKPLVKWLKDNEELTADANLYEVKTEYVDSNNGAVSVQSVLKFHGRARPNNNELLSSDRGVYTCAFENEVKKSESSMHLKIEHEPIVLHKYNKVAFDVSETAEVVCKVLAYPRPEFKWFYGTNLSPLQSSSEGHYVIHSIPEEDTFTSILRISNIKRHDYGDYNCQIVNNLGQIETKIRLQAKGAPERPTKLVALQTGSNFVTLGWEPGFNGGISNTKYFVAYRKVYGGEDDQMVANIEGCGQVAKPSDWAEVDCQQNVPCNVSHLEQHQGYVFKVKALNTKGTSDSSQEIRASTRVDRIPVAQRVAFDPTSHVLSINVPATCLPLVAIVETMAATMGADSLTNHHHHHHQVHNMWHVIDTWPLPVSGVSSSYKEANLDNILSNSISASGLGGAGNVNFNSRSLVDEPIGVNDNYMPRIRVKLCLKGKQESCGDSIEAELGSAYIREASALTTPTIIAIVVCCIIFVLFVGLLLIFCRCKRSKNKKQHQPPAQTKVDYEMDGGHVRPTIVPSSPHQSPGQAPPPYYPSTGMENKALEHSLDLALAMEEQKNAAAVYATHNGYGYHHPHQLNQSAHDWSTNMSLLGGGTVPGGGLTVANYMDQASYSNSNNGGSVNSQDSLWQLKMGGTQNGSSGVIGVGGGGSTNGSVQQTQQTSQQQQQQQQQQGSASIGVGSVYGYDPITHGGYGSVDDYAPYPHITSAGSTTGVAMVGNHPNEDTYTMTSRASTNPSRQDYCTQDPYAAVHKPKKRIEQHNIESPYHDVSGLPDPYLEQMVDEETSKPPQHMSLSYEESLESGYSTPNSRTRRVIREIIV